MYRPGATAHTKAEAHRSVGRPTPPIDSVLRLIMSQMPAVVWATDTDLRFTHSEGGGLADLGLTPGAVLGMSQFEYFGTDDPEYLPIAAHLKALAGEPQAYELEWGDRTFLTHLEPLRSFGGEIVGVVGIAIDITERTRAEQGLRATIAALNKSDTARRSLLFKLVSAQEDEARRIAADVHDGPVQKMTAVSVRLHLLRGTVKDPEDKAAVSQLEEVVTDAIRDTRSLLFHLVPPDLERDGIGAAVHGLLAQLEQETGVRTDLNTVTVVEPSISVAITAYRIVQEAIANIRKHASCTAVGVTLRTSQSGVSLTVTDDGVGFDPSGAVDGGHLGLKAMHERVGAAGGNLDIRSAPGEGTTVELELPTGR